MCARQLRMLALFVPVLVISTPALADSKLTELVESARHAIVIVLTYDKTGHQLGQGTGFFFRPSEVVTNRHVVEGGSRIEVKTDAGRQFGVTHVLSPDKGLDLARLFLADTPKDVLTLRLKQTAPKLGEELFVIGNPLGLESSVSTGIVAATRKEKSGATVFQITAPISPGSSGSPVMDMQGQVFGVATFYLKEGQNLNFALPVSQAVSFPDNQKVTVAAWGASSGLVHPMTGTTPKQVPVVKKSRTGICHDTSSAWYGKTHKFTPFQTLEECLRSGGRLPRG